MSRAGKAYIVTGGASGLGMACVERLAEEGGNVMVLDRDIKGGEAIAAKYPTVKFQEVDVTKEESVKKGVEACVAAFGRLDGIVNSAGVGSATTTIGKRGPHPISLFDIVMKINLYGTFHGCRFAAQAMANNEPNESGLRGCIINVASVAAFEGQKGQVAYSASKGAVAAMSLPMARDLARYGIRVNVIAPGTMATPMMQAVSDQVKENLLNSVVAPKRMGHMSEFAALACHIFDNEYLNAQTYRIDGGIRFANL
jgi:NAD(P)-dependent dehydrogenase (short-subunit alcohol dehydrogenase family)